MTFDQVINVARGYRTMLRDKQHSNTEEQHLITMVDQMETWPPERLEKAFRWLGFIQGALWILCDYQIDELKEHNRTGRVEP